MAPRTAQAAPDGSAPASGTPAAAAPPVTRDRAPWALLVRGQVERILASEDFDASPRSRDFLRYIVEEALAGRGEEVSQYAIARQVFRRREDFDATIDPIVRIQAGRLRRSLERYYLLTGRRDALRIELPRGTYVPAFSKVTEGEAAPAHESKTDGGNAQPTHEQISQRAYGIYLARGSAGDALADWLQAERELAERD